MLPARSGKHKHPTLPLQWTSGFADKTVERVFPNSDRGIEMQESAYDCNCDVVIEMQEMGVGVEEVLQYIRGVLSKQEIRHIRKELERVSSSSKPAIEQFYG